MSKIKKVAFVGGGIDSGIGKIHFNAISLYAKFSLVAGFFSNNKKKITLLLNFMVFQKTELTIIFPIY